MEKALNEVKNGEVFKLAGYEWIKFSDENGVVTAVIKDVLDDMTFGENNDFGKSSILEWLKTKFLPDIEKAVGEENIVEHEVDLFTLDGYDKWGKIKTKVSIPTFDFYRNNVKIFDKYKADKYWWLATADCVSEHAGNDYWVSCVSPDGDMISGICNYHRGVRPFLTFLSFILVSCEE